jgi:holo-[acyl-carrier protein] synthase
MIKGIGIDIIELHRIRELITKQSKLVDRILTVNEKKTYEDLSESRKVEFLAGRFAAKEAFSKAFGTGIGRELSFQDIEVDIDHSGKPFFRKPDHVAHLSISHSREYAVAQVVIED